MNRSVVAILASSLCALACSGSSIDLPSASDGGAAGDDGGGGGGTGTGDDGGVVGHDPTDGGGTTTFDAGVAAPDAIDPVAVGNKWTYDVTVLGTFPICHAGTSVAEVLGAKTVGGKPAFQVQSFCPGAGTSSYYVTGDHVEIYYDGVWVLALDAPVTEGHTWSNGVDGFVWHDVGTVTVPAGTYTRCYEAKEVGSPNVTTFCRGVGPVKWHYEDANGNGYEAILTAKSF